jgi:hypothetical protein
MTKTRKSVDGGKPHRYERNKRSFSMCADYRSLAENSHRENRNKKEKIQVNYSQKHNFLNLFY